MSEKNLSNQAKGGLTKRRLRLLWDDAKAFYVEGTPPSREGEPHQWPTLEQVAAKYEVRHDTLRKRAGREGWGRERRLYASRLEKEKRDAKTAKIAADSAAFDNTTFKLAQALAGEVAQQMRDINKVRQLRDMKARQAEGSDEELIKVLSDPKLLPATANRLAALGTALSQAQRIGRLALGDTTEIVRHEAEVEVEASLSGEVKHKHEHDFRHDPKMVAEVARILKEAGVTE